MKESCSGHSFPLIVLLVVPSVFEIQIKPMFFLLINNLRYDKLFYNADGKERKTNERISQCREKGTNLKKLMIKLTVKR